MKTRLAAGCLALALLSGCGQVLPPALPTPQPTAASLTEASPAPHEIGPSRTHEALSHYGKTLDPTEQELYLALLDCFLDAEPSFDAPVPDRDMLVKISDYVLMDHPEIFWYTGSKTVVTQKTGNRIVGMTLEMEYALDPALIPAARTRIREKAAECLAGIDRSAPDYDKIKAVYDWVILRTDYDPEVLDQNLYSVLALGRGVCSGYAKTIQYLLHQLDIPCLYVTGTAGGQNHAWNIVYADSEPYYLDATWGDLDFSDSSFSHQYPSYISYAYFCVTGGDLLRTHTPDDPSVLPICSATDCSFYRRTSQYLEDYDPDAFFDILEQQARLKQPVTVRFGSPEALGRAYQQLFTQEAIFDMLRAVEKTTFALDSTRIHYTTEGGGDVLVLLPDYC